MVGSQVSLHLLLSLDFPWSQSCLVNNYFIIFSLLRNYHLSQFYRGKLSDSAAWTGGRFKSFLAFLQDEVAQREPDLQIRQIIKSLTIHCPSTETCCAGPQLTVNPPLRDYGQHLMVIFFQLSPAPKSCSFSWVPVLMQLKMREELDRTGVGLLCRWVQWWQCSSHREQKAAREQSQGWESKNSHQKLLPDLRSITQGHSGFSHFPPSPGPSYGSNFPISSCLTWRVLTLPRMLSCDIAWTVCSLSAPPSGIKILSWENARVPIE